MTTVVVVDDQEVVRQGLCTILGSDERIEIVGEAADGSEGLRLLRSVRPDVALVDIRMPALDGIEMTRQLVAGGDVLTRVVILTSYDTDTDIARAFQAGASGFVLKDAPKARLVETVLSAAEGDAPLSPAVANRMVDHWVRRPGALGPPKELDALSERERDVLRLMTDGLSNREIGSQLHLGESTVKTYVGQILLKLGLRDRVQAVVWAYESGWRTPGSS